MASVGTPATGLGYIFYTVLLIVGLIARNLRKGSERKHAKYILPVVLYSVIAMISFIVIIGHMETISSYIMYIQNYFQNKLMNIDNQKLNTQVISLHGGDKQIKTPSNAGVPLSHMRIVIKSLAKVTAASNAIS